MWAVAAPLTAAEPLCRVMESTLSNGLLVAPNKGTAFGTRLTSIKVWKQSHAWHSQSAGCMHAAVSHVDHVNGDWNNGNELLCGLWLPPLPAA